MATKKKEEVVQIGGNPVERRTDGTVTIELFKDNSPRYSDDVFVAVNGKGYQIQRGVPVTVPDYVAEVLMNSATQDKNTARLISMKSNEFKEASRNI